MSNKSFISFSNSKINEIINVSKKNTYIYMYFKNFDGFKIINTNLLPFYRMNNLQILKFLIILNLYFKRIILKYKLLLLNYFFKKKRIISFGLNGLTLLGHLNTISLLLPILGNFYSTFFVNKGLKKIFFNNGKKKIDITLVEKFGGNFFFMNSLFRNFLTKNLFKTWKFGKKIFAGLNSGFVKINYYFIDTGIFYAWNSISIKSGTFWFRKGFLLKVFNFLILGSNKQLKFQYFIKKLMGIKLIKSFKKFFGIVKFLKLNQNFTDKKKLLILEKKINLNNFISLFWNYIVFKNGLRINKRKILVNQLGGILHIIGGPDLITLTKIGYKKKATRHFFHHFIPFLEKKGPIKFNFIKINNCNFTRKLFKNTKMLISGFLFLKISSFTNGKKKKIMNFSYFVGFSFCKIGNKMGFSTLILPFIFTFVRALEKFFLKIKSWHPIILKWVFFLIMLFNAKKNIFLATFLNDGIYSLFNILIKSFFRQNVDIPVEDFYILKQLGLLGENEFSNLSFLIAYGFLKFFFYFFFGVGILNFLVVTSQQWKFVFLKKNKFFLFPKKNWDFLLQFNKRIKKKILISKFKGGYNNIKINKFLNYYVLDSYNFKFLQNKNCKNLFFEYKNITTGKFLFDEKLLNLNTFKKQPFGINSPTFLLGFLIDWGFFYKKLFFGGRWVGFIFLHSGSGMTYQFYNYLNYKFDKLLFYSKTDVENGLLYSLKFLNGFKSVTLSWNFFTSFTNRLSAFLSKGSLILLVKKFGHLTIGNKKGNIHLLKSRHLGGSFISFFNRNFLLNYMVQFGHIGTTLSSFYKQFIYMCYNKGLILNIINISHLFKGSILVVFKLAYYGAAVCLVSSFNSLLEGLVSLYGLFTMNPYTGYIWINGLISNFGSIWFGIVGKLLFSYSGQEFLTIKGTGSLVKIWFVMKGLIDGLGIDIAFFPSLITSGWVFLESNVKFLPTIVISNTNNFIPPFGLDYFVVANDYSLISISFYVNILIHIYAKIGKLGKVEFSLYPTKLVVQLLKNKLIFSISNIRIKLLKGIFGSCFSFFQGNKFFFLDSTPFGMIKLMAFFFGFRKRFLLEMQKILVWGYLTLNKGIGNFFI